MSETKLATVKFGIQSDVIDDTEILNLLESYHREYINLPLSRARWLSHITNTVKSFFLIKFFFDFRAEISEPTRDQRSPLSVLVQIWSQQITDFRLN